MGSANRLKLLGLVDQIADSHFQFVGQIVRSFGEETGQIVTFEVLP